MITAIVQFSLPKPISLEEAARAFESTAPKYQGLQGLVRKYYLRSEDGRRAGGVYLWETRAAAEAVYNGEWKARVKQLSEKGPPLLIRVFVVTLFFWWQANETAIAWVPSAAECAQAPYAHIVNIDYRAGEITISQKNLAASFAHFDDEIEIVGRLIGKLPHFASD
jgi:hypothetical protein